MTVARNGPADKSGVKIMSGVYISNVMAQGLGRLLTLAANFLAFVLIARWLDHAILGKFVFVLNFILIATSLIELGTNTVLPRQLVQIESENAPKYWGNFLLLRIFACFLAAGPLWAIAYMARPELYRILFWCVLALPFFSFRFFEPVFQIYSQPWFSALSHCVFAFSWSLLAVFFLKVAPSLEGIVFGYGLANFFYVLAAFLLSLKLLKPEFTIIASHIRAILKLAFPMWISSVFSQLNIRIAIFMLAFMLSDDAVGMYSVPFRFFEMAVTLVLILMYPLIPIFSKLASQSRVKLKDSFVMAFELTALAVFPIAIATPLLSEPLLHIIFGSRFTETAIVLDIMAWTGALLFINVLTSVVNISLGVVRYGYWNTACALLFSFIFNYYWMIPQYGIVGCALTMLGSEILLLCISMYYTMVNIGNIFNYSKWVFILASNFFLYLVLHHNVFDLNLLFQSVSMAILYIFMLALYAIIYKPRLQSIFR